MISAKIATDIALAHREIANATKLLGEISDQWSKLSNREMDLRDAFGRRIDGLTMGVPTGENSHRLFNVPWRLCRPIIEAHIAEQRTLIRLLSEQALAEARGEAQGEPLSEESEAGR